MKKPKINSKQRCQICFGDYRFDFKSWYSQDICLKCYYEHFVGMLVLKLDIFGVIKYALKRHKAKRLLRPRA